MTHVIHPGDEPKDNKSRISKDGNSPSKRNKENTSINKKNK